MNPATDQETATADHAPTDYETTKKAQARAADPTASAWVSANAGTGKTHVLTQRVLRLLLAGTAPQRILCLTYTKAAAAEMSSRVFATLATWVSADEPALHATLRTTLQRDENAALTPEETARARRLFAEAIETPGGLKVQTIHAFCEQTLQRFPLEAGVPPHFSILDEETSQQLLDDAINATLAAAAAPLDGSLRQQKADQSARTDEPRSALADALGVLVAHASDDRFDELLRAALRQRSWLRALINTVPPDGGDPITQAGQAYRRLFALAPDTTIAAQQEGAASVLDDPTISRVTAVLADGSKSDVKSIAPLELAKRANDDPQARMEALAAFFLTGKKEPRARLLTKALSEAYPALAARLANAAARFKAAYDRARLAKLAEANVSLLVLASDVMQRFAEAKSQRAALDFDDLLERTADLVESEAAWVMFKLDGGLDHILVDEAQDTSALQWRIVAALADAFFAPGARDAQRAGDAQLTRPRTLFAVGDEKQSIFGFQGARPELFAASGASFEQRVSEADQRWHKVPLTLSFRTVAPVLDLVDRVFADPQRTPGLTSAESRSTHASNRRDEAGLVELWPIEVPEPAPDVDPWDLLTTHKEDAAPVRLVNRIADTIAHWLDHGERLEAQGRPLRAGDIMILVRRRRPLADMLVRALKARSIPVAGADRLGLTSELAVEDLLALARFLILPEDDLALAATLKGPLFNLDDDDLIRLAPKRRGTLWQALLHAGVDDLFVGKAAARLLALRRRADFMPPYEFFARLLDEGGRTAILERLGPDASDPLDEFLALALNYDDAAPPSMQGFVQAMGQIDREIKRDMEHGSDQVRIMTVHGSKGLEAPIVFMPDTCPAKGAQRRDPLVESTRNVQARPDDGPAAMLWPTKGSAGLEPVARAKAHAQQLEAAEANRLLYVAMTRARDRLYVAGFETVKGRAKGCWYDLIADAMAGVAAPGEHALGGPVLRYATQQLVPAKPPAKQAAHATVALPPPPWVRTRPPREPVTLVPVAPSHFAPRECDDEGDPLNAPQANGDTVHASAPRTPEAALRSAASTSPSTNQVTGQLTGPDAEADTLAPQHLAHDHRFARGLISHALLEHLPSLPRETWTMVAPAYVAQRGPSLSDHARASVVGEVLAILNAPHVQAYFDANSEAEVPLVAHLPVPGKPGQAIRINGQIDRLARDGQTNVIIDYKTNRPPPRKAAAVPDAYILQLAAYRLALRHADPERAVRCVIIWTDGLHVMDIPDALLDTAEPRLWEAGQRKLDVLDDA
ncbi:MAG: double-strand break repair helicase AddA [Pseudomonadota bacterium]